MDFLSLDETAAVHINTGGTMLRLVVPMLLIVLVVGCDKKDRCSLCETSADCDPGLTCRMFDDDRLRCARGDDVELCLVRSDVTGPEVGAILTPQVLPDSMESSEPPN